MRWAVKSLIYSLVTLLYHFFLIPKYGWTTHSKIFSLSIPFLTASIEYKVFNVAEISDGFIVFQFGTQSTKCTCRYISSCFSLIDFKKFINCRKRVKHELTKTLYFFTSMKKKLDDPNMLRSNYNVHNK